MEELEFLIGTVGVLQRGAPRWALPCSRRRDVFLEILLLEASGGLQKNPPRRPTGVDNDGLALLPTSVSVGLLVWIDMS